MIQTALLITLVAGALATNNDNNSNNSKDLCRLAGTFTAANTTTVSTFNKGGAQAAATALCAALTAQALRVDSADCQVYQEGGKYGVKVAVVEGTSHYECRAYVDNDSTCRGNSGGGNGHKRQLSINTPCGERTTRDECLNNCLVFDPLNDGCECWWDLPSSPQGWPTDVGIRDPCPEGSQCCYTRPCSAYQDVTDCYFLSGGTGDETMDTDSKCVFSLLDGCQCRAPLLPTTPDNYTFPVTPPFDCLCPYPGANYSTSAAECAALVTPTAQQSRELKFLGQRIFVAANKLEKSTFTSQCPRDKVRVYFSYGRRVHVILDKVQSRLRQLSIAFATEYHSDFVDFFFYPSQGGRFRAIAEEDLTKEELEALSPSSIEYDEAKTDAQNVAVLSAAALGAAGLIGTL